MIAKQELADLAARKGPARVAVPRLIGLLKYTLPKDEHDNDLWYITYEDGIQEEAARALGGLGMRAREAIPHLIEAMGSDASSVREACADALFRIGPESLPALVEALRRDRELDAVLDAGFDPSCLASNVEFQDANIRSGAAEVIGRFGDAALPALPALIRALSDRALRVRETAARSIQEIGSFSPTVIQALADALSDPAGSVRAEAARGLGVAGPLARECVPQLIRLLDDSDTSARNAAADAMGKVGTPSPAAAPPLIDIVLGNTDRSRKAAAVALGAIGPKAVAAVPSLVSILNDKDSEVRLAAVDALRAIQPEAEPDSLMRMTPVVWDIEASKLMVSMKMFYLVGKIYSEGGNSVRQACNLLFQHHFAKLVDDEIPTRLPRYIPRMLEVEPLFAEILGLPSFTLFFPRKPGDPYCFTEATNLAWKWTDGFLHRYLPEDWFGFSKLSR